ncbi:hypothetical protein DEO72_LG2g2720 [Vigna unguiculata]|uniref:Uncharacterized protein n=1 Tax=Vigna unguiculata TaxID=3917 RepID=A0A4D6L1P1_VIGUN|nr:hypothetical protein DEO72_LG2g2720 [Vigna unguiculata]
MAAAAAIFSPATAMHQQPAAVSHHLRHLFLRPPRRAPFAQAATNLHLHAGEREPSSSRRNSIFFVRTAAAIATQRTSLAPLHLRSATTAYALPPFVNAPATIASAHEPQLQQRASARATIIRAPPAALQRAPPASSL